MRKFVFLFLAALPLLTGCIHTRGYGNEWYVAKAVSDLLANTANKILSGRGHAPHVPQPLSEEYLVLEVFNDGRVPLNFLSTLGEAYVLYVGEDKEGNPQGVTRLLPLQTGFLILDRSEWRGLRYLTIYVKARRREGCLLYEKDVRPVHFPAPEGVEGDYWEVGFSESRRPCR